MKAITPPQVFEGVRNKKGVRASPSRELTKGEKKRRVVLKRVNTDNLGMRSDFLRSGTMAQVSFTMTCVKSPLEDVPKGERK